MKEVTKIHGQPFKNDVSKLQKELSQITQKVHTKLGDGNYGHLGLITEDAIKKSQMEEWLSSS